MLSEFQNEFLRELDAGLRGLTSRNQRRSLAKRVSAAIRANGWETAGSKAQILPAGLARRENTPARWRAERPMHAAAGCGA